jgi:ABC-type nitrate/sulfonate/bicarbonate transport system substrate-binding protein
MPRYNRSFTFLVDCGWRRGVSDNPFAQRRQSLDESSRNTQAVVAAIVLTVASVAAMAALQMRPRAGTQVAAVFAPWTSGQHAIARVAQAGGLVVRRGIIDTIVVVQSDDPRLIDRLYAAGAWAVIDPAALGGCLAGRADFSG